MSLQIGLGSRIRKSPFHDALMRHGLTHVTVYNHMYMPGSFGDPDEEYRASSNGCHCGTWRASVKLRCRT
ncbi:MAG: hypothetical protein Ct9H300mP12_14760 [Acidimicrobiales bacterium]|nr:MAG: hypothetical protein Ct9H300mP12_14760 [Acidimicrobiales bacterium]